MFKSIINDIKASFSYGNMITRLLILNLFIFVILALLQAFTKNINLWFITVILYIAMPSSPVELMLKPWTIITHMFSHYGFSHILWNMVGLHLFGTIMGDLIGDKKVLPIYLLGGIFGGIVYLITSNLFSNIGTGGLVGASAAISGIAMISGIIAPDYNVRLLLLGNVKLKFIVLFFLFINIIFSQGDYNAGGYYAHLGGMLFGAIYIFLLRQGRDLASPFITFFDWLSNRKATSSRNIPPKSKLRVEHKSEKISITGKYYYHKDTLDVEARIDLILDKIKKVGYDNLSKEEKDFLNRASKK